MSGFITEDHLDAADVEFPGIKAYHDGISDTEDKPQTFLDLLAQFMMDKHQVVCS